jgi:hypothetical protein
MLETTRRLWAQQDQHHGDRERLFGALAEGVAATRVLYPGSYVDVAPSFVFRSVTYVDTDDRAARFFADERGVRELLTQHRSADAHSTVRFLHADYRRELPLDRGSFDLLVSLYAGFVSEHCTDYLRVGGTLLVNPSHGDAAMASIDPRYRLSGVVRSRAGQYSVSRSDLASYLVGKREQAVTVASLHAAGRGVLYTKAAFAYLFERVG